MSNGNGWSYSAYSTAVQCLRKYKLTYVDKLVPEGPESGDLAFGTSLHSAVNASLTGENGPATFEVYWSSYRDKELEYGRYGWEQLAEIGAKFLRNFDKFHAPKYVLEFAEKRLYAEYRGVRLEGTPDYYGLFDGQRSLRDFKTSSRNYVAEKGPTSLQLYLYSFLFWSNFGKYPETLGYTVFNKSTGSIQQLTWKFDEALMYAALDDLVSYCERIDSAGAYPRNLNACLDYFRKCPYYDICHKENKE